MKAISTNLPNLRRFNVCHHHPRASVLGSGSQQHQMLSGCAVPLHLAPNKKEIEITRNISTTARAKFWQYQHMLPTVYHDHEVYAHLAYYVVLPNVPIETPENNIFLESIAQGHEWPPLCSATPEEIYFGTVTLHMELNTTFYEHYDELSDKVEDAVRPLNKNKPTPTFLPSFKMLEGYLRKKWAGNRPPPTFTFDEVFPVEFSRGNYDAHFADATLYLKMLTDWPRCDIVDWHSDLMNVSRPFLVNSFPRLFNLDIVEAGRRIPDSELEKLDPWRQAFVRGMRRQWKHMDFAEGILPVGSKKWDFQWAVDFHLMVVDKYIRTYLTCTLIDPDASNYGVTIKEREHLRHAPPHILKRLAQRNSPEEGPWTATTSNRTIFDVLKFSSSREDRKRLWNAWVARSSPASENGPMCEYNNTGNIEDIRKYAYGYSKLAGYKTHADHCLQNNMLNTPETVRDYIAALYTNFRHVLLQRLEEWRRYAEEHEHFLFVQLQHYDLFYICRREAEHYYGVNTLDLMKYYPAWPTFHKILGLAKLIFNIEFKDITEETAPKMELIHPTIRIYAVIDRSTDEQLARLYLDAVPREGKLIKSGWASKLWRSEDKERGLDKLIWLVGALPEVDEQGRPALWHYEEIQEFMEHFTYIMQNLLCPSPIPKMVYVNPTMGGEVDSASFLQAFFKMFIYKPNLLLAMSSPHVETGEMMSEQTANNMAMALARGSFWDMWRCLFWADYDLTLNHLETHRTAEANDLFREIHQEYFPFPVAPNDWQPCSFQPIFQHPLAMGQYYIRLWMETLACDVYQKFEDENDPIATGRRMRDTWIGLGSLGNGQQWELYTEFMGREPSRLPFEKLHGVPHILSLPSGKPAIARLAAGKQHLKKEKRVAAVRN